ncbi:hypothetical protein GALMADRAFT_239796 [Galerina marginata CBS 339.88]|uniref:Condensation domain-containing protein n=1 Tax=Galerina marginata (strain CBS 339.88) TaxID=685588 RepID=A0A067TEM9_GALM3|nr:hypothetical protein GALMADRAFT_239796 [Galerina marginata CBS 339.88]
MDFSTSSWKRRTGSTTVYERPLGLTELRFYWDGVFERTADTLQHAEVEIDPTKFHEAIHPSNISRTWTDLKLQFPLLGAQAEERDDDSIYFVVSAENLKNCRPGEITFQDIASQHEAGDLVDRMIGQDTLLSENLLACIYVLPRTDLPNYVHLVIHVAHCITDGMSNITILKTFLDRLCQGSPPAPELRQRLSLSVASEDLIPQRKFSVARNRWRKAIANIIVTKRNSRLTGGHTLPRKISQITPYTPADSKSILCSFPIEKSRAIIRNCRENKLTFGNAYPVLGQIALTRVLLRRYLRGELDEEEWNFRKSEPMSSAGPLNLRPLLDKEWIQAGGLSNVCLSIGFYTFSLPFMPLGSASRLRPGVEMPSLESLLSKKRFLLRSKSVKDQAEKYLRHPLFMEFAATSSPARVQSTKVVGVHWRNYKAPPKHLSDKPMSLMEQASAGLVLGNGGSSMGNVDFLLPQNYPLVRQMEPSNPLVQLKTSVTRLRCRPMELYLGAATRRQQLHLSVFWDNNVFNEDLIMEWLDEVRQATDFYLGHEENHQARL